VPSSFEFFTNYGRVFFESDMPRYMLNSVLITVPTVIGAVALSSHDRLCARHLPVQRQPVDLLHVHRRQFRAVPDPHGAGARPDRVDLNLYDTKTGLVLFHIAFQTGFCTLFMRNFIRAAAL
jgi:multiple sugar transport system permease protein